MYMPSEDEVLTAFNGCKKNKCDHIKIENGTCINEAGKKECHCYDFITSGPHWCECPKAKKLEAIK